MPDLVVPTHCCGYANPSANDGEDGENRERKQHDQGRLVRAAFVDGVALVMVRNNYSVSAGLQVHRRSAVVQVPLFVEMRRSKEGLEPQAKHVKRGHARSDEARSEERRVGKE